MTALHNFERTEPLQAWRITRSQFAATALSGQGGLYADGRWHRAGQPVVYLASTWSLAALEVFMHLGRRDSAIEFAYLNVDVPPDLSARTVEVESLPAGWRANPPLAETQQLGFQWLQERDSVLLRVPSALSPASIEYNWLFNPLHPDAPRLIASPPGPFRFDQRMWK